MSFFSVTLVNIRKFSVKMALKQSKKCNVAVCQFTATNDKPNNLNTVKSLINKAVLNEAQIVFLPECCDYIGTTKEETRSLAEPLNGPLMNEYRSLAKENKVWLSIGGFHELLDNGKQRNAHVLINDAGEITGIYRKMHLFDVKIPEKNISLCESEYVEPGNEIVDPIETPIGSLALSICYDLRFSEFAVLLRKRGANILTYPSAFTSTTGQAHWETLLRARAIETQCYVIAAAQYGRHNEKRTSWGQSLIINPWGEIIGECPKFDSQKPTDESIAVASVEINLIEKVRREMPVLQHRRDDCYQLKAVEIPKLDLDDEEVFMFAHKQIPGAQVFYKTRCCYCFTNIRCVVPGHVLVSTRRVAARLEDLTPEEVADLFQTAVKVEKVMEKIHDALSTTLVVQDGSHAGQTIPHVHVHILPRHPNDFPENDQIYHALAAHDKPTSNIPIKMPPFRNMSEMVEEAKMLRNYFS